MLLLLFSLSVVFFSIICYYCCFNHGFKFQNSICSACHDLAMLCPNPSSITIITAEDIDYHCIIHNISKSDAINLSENSLPDEGGYKQNAFQRY